MRIQRNEAAWAELRFDIKTQNTETCSSWVTEVLVMPDMAGTLRDVV